MSEARVCQINVSAGGVPKTPIASAVVGELGIIGDGHRFRYHGGPRKSLLLVASEVIDQLRYEGWPVYYGALGENLTTKNLAHSRWRPGQRYSIGDVLVELTTPRQPCATLNVYGSGIQKRIYDDRVRALDASSAHWGESGFYTSVIRPGTIDVDAPIVPRD